MEPVLRGLLSLFFCCDSKRNKARLKGQVVRKGVVWACHQWMIRLLSNLLQRKEYFCSSLNFCVNEYTYKVPLFSFRRYFAFQWLGETQ
jgi:hypothetical protein